MGFTPTVQTGKQSGTSVQGFVLHGEVSPHCGNAREIVMNVFEKLNAVREEFLKTEHKKTGGKAEDRKAYFSYFELSDFLPEVLALFSKNKLYGHFSVIDRTANLEIINVESPEEKVVFSMPFGSAKLANCHEIQNIGACITYARRYLWGCAVELTENDAIDGSTSRGENPENFGDLETLDDFTDVFTAMGDASTVE